MTTEERLIQFALCWDELGHVGQAVELDYCDCEDCRVQTELRKAIDELKAERAAA